MNVKKSLQAIFRAAKKRLFPEEENFSLLQLPIVLVETYNRALAKVLDYSITVEVLNEIFFESFETKLKSIGVLSMDAFLTQTINSVIVGAGITPVFPTTENTKEEDPKEEDPKEEDPKEEDPKEEDPKEEDPKEEGIKLPSLKDGVTNNFRKVWNYLKKKKLNNMLEAYEFNRSYGSFTISKNKNKIEAYLTAYEKVARFVIQKGYSIEEMQQPYAYFTGQKEPMNLIAVGKFLNPQTEL